MRSIYNDIISIQPMTVPTGLIFYLDNKYGSVVEKKEVVPYISLDSSFRTKNINSWMYSDTKNKVLRELETPLNLP